MALRRALSFLRFPRLHLSTWIVLAFVAVIMFLLEAPGQIVFEPNIDIDSDFPGVGIFDIPYQHGWPLTYATHEALGPPPSYQPSCWVRGCIEGAWGAAALGIDLLVVGAILALCAVGLEYRRRVRRSFLQFTIFDLAVAVAALACVAGYFSALFRESREEQAALTGAFAPDDGLTCVPACLTWLAELTKEYPAYNPTRTFVEVFSANAHEERTACPHLKRLKVLSASSEGDRDFLSEVTPALKAVLSFRKHAQPEISAAF